MTSERIPVLVLGLGNVLCGDDGAGVEALQQLQRRYELAPGVVALDGGTLGLSLLALVDSADQVIIVDAILADGAPGTLVRIEGDEVGTAVYERLSPHQIGVADLLAGAALVGRYPDRVLILGVVPETTDLALNRSAAVNASIPALVERVVEELSAMGYPPRPRVEHLEEHGHDPARSRDDVGRTLGV